MSKTVKVKWLKAHSNWSYYEGNVASINAESAKTLESDGYLEILPDNWQPVLATTKPVQANVRVRWLKVHSAFSYNAGMIGNVTTEAAIMLLEGEYIEVLPDDYVDPVPVQVQIPASNYIKVLWLKPHSDFAYKEGTEGVVAPDKIKMLESEGFVQSIAEDNPGKKNLIARLKGMILNKIIVNCPLQNKYKI